MYQAQTHPDKEAVLDNGSVLHPLVTLLDPNGGVAHIIHDDHCYVLVISSGCAPGRVKMTPWWFPEAFEAARSLPPLTQG